MSDVTIGPLERFVVGIVSTDVAHNFAFEIVSRREDAASDQIALNFGEPDFDLIEPRRVSRGCNGAECWDGQRGTQPRPWSCAPKGYQR